jgi:predicted nucleic acid-binding protein
VSQAAFIDSGAFIAFLLRSDRLHGDVVSLFAERPQTWYTSVLVISETYSWFLHRLGEEAAQTFRALLDRMTGLEVLDADADHRAAVWTKLDDLRGYKLSYVDASSLVWLEQRQVTTVWGTDRHLAVEGARVIPGPPTL